MIAFVIGNGRSREGIALEDLAKNGKVFGCNAIYRDFTPYVLVSVDKGITMEISKNKIPERMTHYARHPQHPKTIKLDPKKHHSRSASGPVATKLAAMEEGVKKVYLVGVDLNSPDGKVNNIYAGTSNYRAVTGPAVKWHKWEKQYLEVFKQHSGVEFYRIIPTTRYIPSIWKGQRNIHHLERDDFAKEFGIEVGKVTYTATPAPTPPAEPKRASRPEPQRRKPEGEYKLATPIHNTEKSGIVYIGGKADGTSKYWVFRFEEGNKIVSSNEMFRTRYKGKYEEANQWAETITKKLNSANSQDRKRIRQEIINTILRK